MKSQLLASFVAGLVAAAACHSTAPVDPRDKSDHGTLRIVSAAGNSTRDTVVIGGRIWFTAMPADSSAPRTPGPWEWSVSDTTVLSIVALGEGQIWLRAQRTGQATVTVRSDGEFGTHEVVVRELRASDTAVAHIQIGFLEDTVNAGDSVLVGFNLYDAKWDLLDNRAFTVTLSDSSLFRAEPYDGGDHSFKYRVLKVGSTFFKVICGTQQDSVQFVAR